MTHQPLLMHRTPSHSVLIRDKKGTDPTPWRGEVARASRQLAGVTRMKHCTSLEDVIPVDLAWAWRGSSFPGPLPNPHLKLTCGESVHNKDLVALTPQWMISHQVRDWDLVGTTGLDRPEGAFEA